jgi:hypothetical protein
MKFKFRKMIKIYSEKDNQLKEELKVKTFEKENQNNLLIHLILFKKKYLFVFINYIII